ncbi:MAG TPA: ABC transporter transmembrane domain-containing protein [Ktedonobacteraceae bacterium]|nr:ABC transporter transmembrane domain-containing protein [Ktedonobacteraceae bacterium]
MTKILAGVTTMKAAGAEQKAFQRWSNLFFNQLNVSVRLDYMTAVIGIATGALSILAPLALLWVGAIEVLSGSMQLGTMLALSTLAGELLVPLTSLARSGQHRNC